MLIVIADGQVILSECDGCWALFGSQVTLSCLTV
jgi:hypothetical protein